MKLAHLHRHGKALQDATSAITDDGFDLPSDGFQCLDSFLVRCNGFIRQKLPEEILRAVRTPPDHDAEESPEVRGVHDDDHLIGCQFLLLHLNPLQLSLHPLRAASVRLRNLRMGLFAVRELMPDLFRVSLLLLTRFFTA